MSQFEHINVNGLKTRLETGGVQVVDIRDPMSFRQGHIKGAHHLDNNSLKTFLETADRSAPVVVCCYHGNSSQQAAAFLSSEGFQSTYSLDGGFALWQSSYPEWVESA